MSIFKDWREDTEGYVFRHKLKELVNPRSWLRLRKWRKQRADRGWSDRDTWGAGDHIAKMTAEMLQHLNDHSYCDWPEWFKLNVQEAGRGSYKNLQLVIDDINNYLQFELTSWADGLYCDSSWSENEDGSRELVEQLWYDEKTKKVQTEAAIKRRIGKWQKENIRLYDKASKAMGFFASRFSSFWD